MTFSRNSRNDRRRRVMREAAVADSQIAVESSRARKRQRQSVFVDPEEIKVVKRDPGYSHAVRRACQHRLVQLIPVRPISLSLFLVSCLTIWGLLVFGHYFFHTFAQSTNVTPSTSEVRTSSPLPISYLFHMRSNHGIAHWLGGQLWMLTAIASLMIFQLKRHKLDDYRAKYRVWIALAIAAAFFSLDASTSALVLFGKTIDRWALREVGYSGWSLVLATTATIVGILGLRLCTELKNAPGSLCCWLVGLGVWAFSALLGTGLLKSGWSPATIDMTVGATWLLGIMSVFFAASIYLRHIYIDAQRRFVTRTRMIKHGAWKLPSLRRREQPDDARESDDDENEEGSEQQSRGEKRRTTRSGSTKEDNNRREQYDEEDTSRTQRFVSKVKSLGERIKNSRVRLPKWRSDPRLGEDYSDVSSEQRLRDEGFESPMGKKPGWFAKSAPKSSELDSNAKPKQSVNEKGNASPQTSKRTNDTEAEVESRPSKKSWLPSFRRGGSSKSAKTATDRPNALADPEKLSTQKIESKKSLATDSDGRGWFSRKKNSTGSESLERKQSNGEDSQAQKKSMLGRFIKSKDAKPSSDKNKEANATEKTKRKWGGLFEGLKLKPPTEASQSGSGNPKKSALGPAANNSPLSAHVKAASSPSSQSNAPSNQQTTNRDSNTRTPFNERTNNNSRPQSNAATNVSSQRESDDENFDEDGTDNRQLSRAERKRLRKQQSDNRRAA